MGIKIEDLDQGIAPLSEADKRALADTEAEKKRLGIIDDEPREPATPAAPEVKEDIVLGPETDKKEDTPAPEAPANQPEAGDKKPPEGEGKKAPDVPDRPEKYIPIPKYLQEKRDHEAAVAVLNEAALKKDQEIQDLKLKLEKKGTSQEERDEEIAGLADKLGIEPETIEELMGVAEKRMASKVKPADTPIAPVQPTPDAPVDTFPDEWKKAEPALRTQYPTATTEQLEDAKKVLDEAAHGEFRRFPMDYVLFKMDKDLKTILSSPRRKTVESGSHGKGDTPPAQPTRPDFENMTPQKAKEIERANAQAADAEGQSGRLHRNGEEIRL